MTLPLAPVKPYQNVILVEPAGWAIAGTGVMVGAGGLVAAGALVVSALAIVGAPAAAPVGSAAAGAAVAAEFAAPVGTVEVVVGLPPHAPSKAAARLTSRSMLIFL